MAKNEDLSIIVDKKLIFHLTFDYVCGIIVKNGKGRTIFMIKRENYLSKIRPFINQTELVKVIVGVRRSGKSVMLELIKEELFSSGVPIENTISINFEDMSEAIPAFLTILFMPLAYSISEGIAVGVISYTLINLICGKVKKITPLMYVLTVLFICKYIFL